MKYRINLLPEKEETVLDRLIFFSFNYLRYILVITQLVVIFVFMFRFNIDQEIVDTKDTLQQKQEIIKVSQPLLAEGETMFRRVENITGLLKKQNTSSQMLEYVLSRFPEQFSLSSLDIKEDTLSFQGLTSDANVIKSFYSKLQQEKRFKSVNLVNVQKTTQGFTFSFVLTQFI